MSQVFSIHELAEIEINEAIDFYEMECIGLGDIFLDEIETAIKNIYQFPEAYQLVNGRVRKRNFLKFPYAVIYSIHADEIRILAVAHHKRRPFYWRGRR